MEIDIRDRGEVVVAALKGRLGAGVGDEELRQLIDGLLADQRKWILLDLSQLTSMDSSGVGELVAGLRVANELGAKLKLLRGPDRVQHTLRMGQMLPLFDIYDTEEEALEAFEA